MRKIRGGVYLVINPASGLEVILPKLKKAIEGGIDVLQIWNHWGIIKDKHDFIRTVCWMAHESNIPVLINEEWQWLEKTELDGVHFDKIPMDIKGIRHAIGRPFLCGITCGNDISVVKWAAAQKLDYVSFCSMFPSESAGICEIVNKETVRQARQLTSLPIFLAGGITLENADGLQGTGFDGLALISAIMKAEDPKAVTKSFKEKLKKANK